MGLFWLIDNFNGDISNGNILGEDYFETQDVLRGSPRQCIFESKPVERAGGHRRANPVAKSASDRHEEVKGRIWERDESIMSGNRLPERRVKYALLIVLKRLCIEYVLKKNPRNEFLAACLPPCHAHKDRADAHTQRQSGYAHSSECDVTARSGCARGSTQTACAAHGKYASTRMIHSRRIVYVYDKRTDDDDFLASNNDEIVFDILTRTRLIGWGSFRRIFPGRHRDRNSKWSLWFNGSNRGNKVTTVTRDALGDIITYTFSLVRTCEFQIYSIAFKCVHAFFARGATWT